MTKQANQRDLMAPETEPSDEDLHIVMKEALDLALSRKQLSDQWMREQLLAEVIQARQSYRILHL